MVIAKQSRTLTAEASLQPFLQKEKERGVREKVSATNSAILVSAIEKIVPTAMPRTQRLLLAKAKGKEAEAGVPMALVVEATLPKARAEEKALGGDPTAETERKPNAGTSRMGHADMGTNVIISMVLQLLQPKRKRRKTNKRRKAKNLTLRTTMISKKR